MAEPTLYRQLPAIDKLLQFDEAQILVEQSSLHWVTECLREMQAQARTCIADEGRLPDWHNDWLAELSRRHHAFGQSALKNVFNLTGTVLHTNLGRSVMSKSAITAVAQVMSSPVTLEYSLDGAMRGHRDRAIADLLCQLTGAEDACIVNNNAAAVLLLLATVAPNQQVIVSRGELVEIGGAFRVPDVMEQAGCQLVEVGTTNRTHLRDYEKAINEDTALLMKVHTSNYSIEGFTAEVDGEALAELGKKYQLPTAIDLGSGSMIDMTAYGLPAEPMPQTYLSQGIDLVSISGDKLLGGPQAGIILGKKKWIDAIQKHPLKRALRVDKMILAALEATLKLYLTPEKLTTELPTLRWLTRSPEEIRRSAENILVKMQAYYGDHFIVEVESCLSQIGSGSLPIDRLPSYAITFAPLDGKGGGLERLAARWRQLPQPVIGRLKEGKLWLDLRCLDDEHGLVQALLS
ncbi:L-seryl-tRNA(Sec) selenium transferase [Providencia rustigianii]|uniref:L-seryl-tRNA(Sec) selenium transferase n=1 Tax=Providencia rustigianii DSM 4541 TaxID=500637 RepID=D1P7F1_9GAMM|nr:L-seryl-tRNA(Sec) selenium transferase [Providencia rustigianii]EFB70691.1 L-seryl-tRNA(Sec) selenium transferase [Providencia rustigianii DSM 4541]SUC29099.1 L-seryl-tRNA(Sec) selenium transferase [Providencia rustigianii]